ncbi:acetate--CoA ligase family protein [Rhodococcus koreensis]
MESHSVDALNKLFLPETIAVVGASETPGRVGHLSMAAISKHFVGQTIPVNPRYNQVMGIPAHATISDLPDVPDLAVVATPAQAALPVVRECVETGVGGVLVFGSGFAETGAEGAALQAELADLVKGTNTRLLGPNSLGFFDATRGTLASFLFAESTPAPRPGPLALVSQSGGFAEQLLARSEEAGLGMSWMISTGNELDINVSSGFEFLLEQDSAEIIVLFAESIKDPAKFVACAEKARATGRPVIVIKTGRSDAGARAAVTHTASMAGSDRVFAQICEDLGIVRVDTLDDVLDVARVLAPKRKATGQRLAIVTASGGGGVLAADLAEDAGLSVPLLSDAEQAKITSHIPGFGTANNPIDVTAQGAENNDAFRAILESVTDSPEIDMLACVFSSHGRVAIDVANTIADVYERTAKPVVAVWGSPEVESVEAFKRVGLPFFGNPRNALQALAATAKVHLAEAKAAVEDRADTGAAVTGTDRALSPTSNESGLVLEAEAQAFLAKYGVRSAQSRAVRSPEEALTAARDLGFPLVLKLVAEHVPHREKAGGISLNVSSVQQVQDEFARLRDILPTQDSDWYILVQQQLPRGLEIVVGAQRDPDWGVTVLVGIGGTQTELINRSALRLAPVTSAAAVSAVQEVFGTHLKDDTVRDLAGTIQAVSAAMTEHPTIDSIDVNPLIVTPNGLVAVDALISTQQ